MFELYAKIWEKQYRIPQQEIFYLYFGLLILLGCGSAFIVTLFKGFYLKIIVTVALIYIFSNYNLQIALKLIMEMPEMFKQNYRMYFKYRLLVQLVLDPLLVSYCSFMLTYGIWELLSSSKEHILEVYTIALILPLLSFAVTLSLKRYLLKILAYVLFAGALYLSVLEFYWLAEGSFLVVLSLALYLNFDRRELSRKQSGFLETRYLKLNYLAGTIRYDLATKLFETVSLCIYAYLAFTFKLEFSILPLIVVYVLFENLIYLQMIFLKSKHFKARALFLQGSKLKWSRLIYGNLVYRDLYYLLLFVVTVICSLYYGFFNLAQVVLATCYLVFALLYFTYLEKVVSLTGTKRPNFYEEYLGLVLITLLVLVK